MIGQLDDQPVQEIPVINREDWAMVTKDLQVKMAFAPISGLLGWAEYKQNQRANLQLGGAKCSNFPH